MIEVENLRIGNFIRGEEGHLCIVNNIDYPNKKVNDRSVDSFEYISVSDELLEHNNFQKKVFKGGYEEDIHFILNENFDLTRNKDGGYSIFVEDEKGQNDIEIDIYFVNELQNVYKLLKRKELNFIF